MGYLIKNDRTDMKKVAWGYLPHARHGATPMILFLPSNFHSLKKIPSQSSVEPSFVPTAWLKGCPDFAIELSPL